MTVDILRHRQKRYCFECKEDVRELYSDKVLPHNIMNYLHTVLYHLERGPVSVPMDSLRKIFQTDSVDKACELLGKYLPAFTVRFDSIEEKVILEAKRK
jgi:hypothetical protein